MFFKERLDKFTEIHLVTHYIELPASNISAVHRKIIVHIFQMLFLRHQLSANSRSIVFG